MPELPRIPAPSLPRGLRSVLLAPAAALLVACGEADPLPRRFSAAMAHPPRTAGTAGPTSAPAEAPIYSEGLAPVRRDGKYGFADTAGNLVIPARFAHAEGFREGRAAVLDGSLWGYVDRLGNLAITPGYAWAGPFREGRAPVSGPDGFVFLDTAGNRVGSLAFSEARGFSEGLAAVRFGEGEEAAWGFLARDGRLAIPPLFADAGPGFSQGRAAVATAAGWGYIDTSGGFVIEARFDAAGGFSEGLAAVGRGAWSGGRFRGAWTYVDTAGRPAFPGGFARAEAFSGGRARVLLADGTRAEVDRAGRAYHEGAGGATADPEVTRPLPIGAARSDLTARKPIGNGLPWHPSP